MRQDSCMYASTVQYEYVEVGRWVSHCFERMKRDVTRLRLHANDHDAHATRQAETTGRTYHVTFEYPRRSRLR